MSVMQLVRSIRIWSGLFLLGYVTSHLLNLSLGIVSLQAMEAARPYLSGFWTNAVLSPVLIASLAVHFFLGLWSVYRRPTLRTNTQDLIQMISGVLVMPLLATHAVGVSMTHNLGVPFGYVEANQLFWIYNPVIGLLQVVLLSVVWVHGCAGLFTWLRGKDGAQRSLVWLYPLAVAIPVFALLGFGEAGRVVLVATQNGTALPVAETGQDTATMTQAQFETIKTVTSLVIWGSSGLAALALFARWVRQGMQRASTVSVRLGTSGATEASSGLTLLDVFRHSDQPHASLCQGRGRCGTCAVRVISSEFPLPAPTKLEQTTLFRTGAPDGARLACQLSPSGGSIHVAALYPPDYNFDDDQNAPASQYTQVEGGTS